MRSVTFVSLAAATLALAGSAQAWTRLTPDSLPNSVGASVLTTASGTQLVGWADSSTGSVLVLRLPSTQPEAIVSGWPQVGTPRFVQLRTGNVVAFFSGRSPDEKLRGVLRAVSRDEGATWSPPVQTASSDMADVASAAIGPSGKPIFLQAGSLFVDVHVGLPGQRAGNVFTPCCAYGPSIAVDSAGLAQIALWSLAPGLKGFLYGALSPAGSLQSTWLQLSGPNTVVNTEPVPIAVDRSGDTFVAWSARAPVSAVSVSTLRGGRLVRTVRVATGSFGISDPHTALAVDASDRLWVLWTRGGTLWAARSRTGGASFGATAATRLPGGRTAYRLSALADDTGVTAFVNLGAGGQSALWREQLLPVLTVTASNGFLRVRDDGVPVTGAVVQSGPHKLVTDAAGRVLLRGFKRHSLVSIGKQGYSPAVFRVP